MSRRWLFCIGLACFLSFISHGHKLTLSINDWCPYICDPSAKQPGILIEIVQNIFQAEGHEINFHKMPLNRAALEIGKNKVQGMIGIVPEVLPNLIFPEEPVIKTQFCFFTLSQQTWLFKGFKSYYPGTRVGVVAGKKISIDFDRAFPNKEDIYGVKETATRLIEMLILRRVDTFIEEKTTIAYALRINSALPSLRIAGCAEKKNEYVAFSPTDPRAKEYAILFSKGIRRLKKSGKIDEIIASYLD